jgi:hypothetical protein
MRDGLRCCDSLAVGMGEIYESWDTELDAVA